MRRGERHIVRCGACIDLVALFSLDASRSMTHTKRTMITNDQARTMQHGSQHTLGRRLRLRLRVVALRLRSVA
jgi:hypothetical protein